MQQNQNEIEAILSLIRQSYRELGNRLDLVEEALLMEHSTVSIRPSLNEISKLAKLVDILEEIKD